MIEDGQLFALGRVLKANEALALGSELDEYLLRHVTGDWGKFGKYGDTGNSAARNMQAIRYGGSVLSFYRTGQGWLAIGTTKLAADGRADGDTETRCLLLTEVWTGPLDGLGCAPASEAEEALNDLRLSI